MASAVESADLKSYSEFSPTPFDAKGLALPDRQDWLVSPVSITRDTGEGSITRSNWEAIKKALTALDPDRETWDTHVFNHWGPGWFELLIVAPQSAAHVALAEMVCALESYPVLDDMDHSKREHESALETWNFVGASDAVMALVKAFDLCDAARALLNRADSDGLLSLLQDMGAVEICYAGESPYFEVMAHHLDRADMAAILWTIRAES